MVSSRYVWYSLRVLVSVLTKLTYISKASSFYGVSLRCVAKLIEILLFLFLVVCLSGLFELHFFELCLPPLFDINNQNGPALSEWKSGRVYGTADTPRSLRLCAPLSSGKAMVCVAV